MGRVRRRQFIYTIGVVLAAPAFAIAQQESKRRIGFMGPNDDLVNESLVQGLRELGYVEGKEIVIERRFTQGNLSRLPAVAAELAGQRVEIIVAATTPGAQAAKRATNAIPIVFVNSSDPVGAGLIATFARPGGNVTGVSNVGLDLSAKRLQLLKETFPKIKRVAVHFSDDPIEKLLLPEVERAAKALKLETRLFECRDRDQLESALSSVRQWRADSLYVLESTSAFFRRHLLAEFEIKSRLPAIFAAGQYAEAGGLMSYGANYAANFRRAAVLVDKILKGANPRELPAERPTTFDFVVNLKTAKLLGLTIPQSVLQRADRLIE